MSEAARSHRPDLRVEPYMDPPSGARSDVGGPLAELARVVGQDDPFRAMFQPSKVRAAPEASAASAVDLDDHPGDAGEAVETGHDEAGYWPQSEPHAIGLRPSSHDEQDWIPPQSEAAHRDNDGFVPQHPSEAGYDGHSDHAQHPVAEMPIDSPNYVAPPMTPDLWAEHEDANEDTQPATPVLSDESAADTGAPRRPLVVLLAVLALTGGGLAATFLSRTGSNAAVAPGVTPTIMAASGPTKIKQADGPSETTPEDADAALLNKRGASSGGPVKVLNSQEQPIDLAQLPKAAGSPGEGAPSAASPFPEPKKVKTFLVRPDGSLVGAAPAKAAPVRSTVSQFAAGIASADATDTAAPPSTAARPSTPKTASRSPTTPKASPTSISDLTAPDAPAPDAAQAKAKQPGSSGAKTASAAKPVEVADAAAAETTATTGPSGNFALQLAASPSEQDARSAFTKLQKKYTELGAYQPMVKKVDNGQKTIYRLRVGNLAQDQAKTLCSQLQASGGSCFVVHN